MVYAKVVNGLKNLRNKRPFPVKLKFDKTYIIPTGFGLAFAALSFVLLVMAIGYANNLLYFFVFLLISMGISGMWLTNKNVESIKMNDVFANQSLFAQEKNQVRFELQNRNKKSFVWDVEIQLDGEKCLIDEVQRNKQAEITWVPAQRGHAKIPRFLIQSRFPYQMLRAWKYFEKKTELIIYPERKGTRQIPLPTTGQDSLLQAKEHGLFRDYRDYQRTDSPNRIDWKRSLRHQKHLVKNFESHDDQKILLDWQMTSALSSFEERVSQLSLWVDLCHSRKNSYSLKIAKGQTEYQNHFQHYKNCMEKLAFLKPGDVL